MGALTAAGGVTGGAAGGVESKAVNSSVTSPPATNAAASIPTARLTPLFRLSAASDRFPCTSLGMRAASSLTALPWLEYSRLYRPVPWMEAAVYDRPLAS